MSLWLDSRVPCRNDGAKGPAKMRMAGLLTRLALPAIDQNPDADLRMSYIEQPDGSGHPFMLIDDRQATNTADPNSIGSRQDNTQERSLSEDGQPDSGTGH